MSKPLLGTKIAILIANGFCEQDMTETQRALAEAKANMRIVSTEQGLVNSWTGEGWGHHFAVDTNISTALGADFDMLIIPGGQRSHDKLKLTAHTRRFVSSFMASHKPVIVFNDALNIMLATGNVTGHTFNGPEAFEAQIMQAGGNWSAETPCQDGPLMSGKVDQTNRKDFIQSMVGLLVARATMNNENAAKAA
jgi:protease I